MQVVESYRQKSCVKQHMLWSLGHYDEAFYKQAKNQLRYWKKLERASVVIKELNDVSGPIQGKGYFKNFNRRLL